MGAESLTVDGLWILSPPFRRLDADAARTEIGKAVLEVAGIKSWSTLVKGAVLVDVSIEEEWATLAPTRNLGAREGFEDLDTVTALHTRSTMRTPSENRSCRPSTSPHNTGDVVVTWPCSGAAIMA